MNDGLTTRQRAVLAALCDTFQPGAGPDLLERAAGLIASLPNADDRLRLRLLLSALGSPFVNLALSGRFKAFDTMDQPARIAVLRGWAESAIQLRRAGFQALKKIVNVVYYAWPTEGPSHPAWRAAGYPGPLPPPRLPLAPRLPTFDVSADLTLDCDVVICGSGAGGGVAAGVLAEAGRSVIVLEKGENLGPEDFSQVEGDMLKAGYLDAGLLMTQSGSLPILAGSCLGGGTVINWTSSFALREPTRAEWDRRSGLSLFESAHFTESFQRVMRRSDVNTDNSVPGVRDQLLEKGLRACGYHVGTIPRNATGCAAGSECGYCGYGCRHNAKNSTAKTYLADAVAHGARLVVRCNVERVVKDGGRATGVTGTVRTADGRTVRLTVRARAVIAACGALHTPALLARLKRAVASRDSAMESGKYKPQVATKPSSFTLPRAGTWQNCRLSLATWVARYQVARYRPQFPPAISIPTPTRVASHDDCEEVWLENRSPERFPRPERLPDSRCTGR